MSGSFTLELPIILERAKLLLKLAEMVLIEPKSKKDFLEFLECCADIAGLVEIVDAGLDGGLFHYNLEIGVTHGQVEDKHRGLHIVQAFKSLGILSVIVDLMLLNRDNVAPLYHHLVGFSP